VSEAPAALAGAGRELYARHARLDGRTIAVLRAVDEGHRCVVEAEVWPSASSHPYGEAQTARYTFPSAVEATRFITNAVEALIAIGCDVRAS
jgi:hypothetical protein